MPDSLTTVKLFQDSIKINQLQTKLDSLAHITSGKLDSLSNVTRENSVGKGFFTDILSMQTGIFSIVFASLGLITWGGVIFYLRQIQKAGLSKINTKNEAALTKIEELKKTLADDISELKSQNLDLRVDVKKSIALGTFTQGMYPASLIWSLSIAQMYNQEMTVTDEADKAIFELINHTLQKIIEKKQDIDNENYENALEKISSLQGYKDGKHAETIKKLKAKLNAYYHAPKAS